MGITSYHQDTKNATPGSRSSCQGWFSRPQTRKREPSVAFSCLGYPCTLPTTLYHPDTKNAIPGSRSSFQRWFSTPQTRKREPSVAFSCLGYPCTLPTTLYHPDTKNATLWSHSSCLECCRHPPCSFYGPDMNDATLQSRSSCLGCPCTYPTTLYQPRHEERDRRVASFMSAPFPAPLPPRHEERIWRYSPNNLWIVPPSFHLTQTRKCDGFSCLGYFPI